MGLYISPLESAIGWSNMFDDFRERSVEHIGRMVTNSLSRLDKVIGEKLPGTAFLRCTTHLKCNMLTRGAMVTRRRWTMICGRCSHGRQEL